MMSKRKKIKIALLFLSVLLSIFLSTAFVDGNEKFVSTQDGSIGTAFSDFIALFLFFEIFFIVLIFGLSTFFKKSN